MAIKKHSTNIKHTQRERSEYSFTSIDTLLADVIENAIGTPIFYVEEATFYVCERVITPYNISWLTDDMLTYLQHTVDIRVVKCNCYDPYLRLTNVEASKHSSVLVLSGAQTKAESQAAQARHDAIRKAEAAEIEAEYRTYHTMEYGADF